MSQPISESIARNSQYRCKAIGCNTNRYNLSGYCSKHNKTFKLFGNPHGKALRGKTYKKESEDALAIISSNLEHTSTQTAIKFIQSWLDKSKAGVPCVCATEMSRLAYADVTALKILLESTAIFLYSQRNPKSLPDGLELSYQMSVGILRLAPQVIVNHTPKGYTVRRKANATERKAIGKYLRESLGLFYYNVFNTISRKEKEEYDFRQSLYTPLEIKAPTHE
jgi:hypothetical protein